MEVQRRSIWQTRTFSCDSEEYRLGECYAMPDDVDRAIWS